MWQYLQGLPPILSFTIILMCILALVFISFRGKLVARWGKNLVGLGDAKIENDKSEDSDDEKATTKPALIGPPSTVLRKSQKRSCGDCILIVIGEREKYELNMKRISNKILKQQMNHVEQKLIEMQTLFISAFMGHLNTLNGKVSEDQYEVQYKLYYGLMKDCLVSVKDEFRRSLKENGFFEFSDVEFSNYVKEKTQSLISAMSQHLRNFYPTRGIIVPVGTIIAIIENSSNKLQEYLFGIYGNAKQIIVESDKEVAAIQEQFSRWVDNFVN
jgi:hypothetical protein